jgi:hypothetical protein
LCTTGFGYDKKQPESLQYCQYKKITKATPDQARNIASLAVEMIRQMSAQYFAAPDQSRLEQVGDWGCVLVKATEAVASEKDPALAEEMQSRMLAIQGLHLAIVQGGAAFLNALWVEWNNLNNLLIRLQRIMGPLIPFN